MIAASGWGCRLSAPPEGRPRPRGVEFIARFASPVGKVSSTSAAASVAKPAPGCTSTVTRRPRTPPRRLRPRSRSAQRRTQRSLPVRQRPEVEALLRSLASSLRPVQRRSAAPRRQSQALCCGLEAAMLCSDLETLRKQVRSGVTFRYRLFLRPHPASRLVDPAMPCSASFSLRFYLHRRAVSLRRAVDDGQ